MRKWLVRGLVFGVLGSIFASALLYQAWTNPTATRRQVLGQLDKVFVGANVSLDSARLRLLGGISFSDLRMTRRDDLERGDFLYVPDGIIYHDKERLANGDLAVRKIELHRARLRIVRDHDGHWNVAGLLSPVDLSQRMPTLVFQQTTLVLEDHTTPLAGPLLEIKDVNLTVINDPLPTLVFDGGGVTDVGGPVHLSGKLQRATGDLALALDAPTIPVGPALIERFAALAPEVAAQARTLHGEGRIQATVAYRPAAAQPLTYDATVSLTKSEFTHPKLAWPLQDGDLTAHIVNGSIPLIHCKARSGPSLFEATLKDLSLAAGYSVKDDGSVLTDLVREMDFRFEHVHVDDKLFDFLPETMKSFKTEYRPSGFMSMTHTFHKNDNGRWTKHFLLTAEDMQATYHLFPYTVDHITGTIDVEYDNDFHPLVKLDLLGRSNNRSVTLSGTAQAARNNSFIDIDIAAENVPLDAKLYKALPEPTQHLVKEFLPEKNRPKGMEMRPMGIGDFKVQLRRQRGSPDFKQWFFITFHDTSLCYDLFPYPLENLSGVLEIYPDHWEAKHFHGMHNGGTISFSGHSQPPAGRASVTEPPGQVRVELHGKDIDLKDADFLAALEARPALHQTWQTLNLFGQMNFDAEITDVPHHEQDRKISVTIGGCRMKPKFFEYAMEEVCGHFTYSKDCVRLENVTAKHGDSVLRLTGGDVYLKRLSNGDPGSGGFQARLEAIQGTPIVVDDDFLKAMHPTIQEGLKAIKLKGPVWAGTKLVIDSGPNPELPPLIWWDGGVFLRDATMVAGVEVSKINGLITCCGTQKGPDRELVGHVALEQLSLLNQPVQDVHARFCVLPESPTILRVHDLTGQLFGGKLGGEGRVEFGPTFKYDTTLKALGVRLEDFGRHNFGSDSDLQGPVCAALHLMGEGRDIGGLKGNGRISVCDARLYTLPALLDLLKAFGLRLPDRTAFDQASATVSIDGPQVRFEQIDMVGNAISLRGQGTAGINGDNINLDFNADWARLGQFLPEPVTGVPRALSDQLLKVKVRGRLGDVRFTPELVPAITEPWKHLFGNEK